MCLGSAYRIAFGHRAGQKVLTLRGAMPREASARQPLCADIDGFSLHAAVRVQANDRKRLEQLCRYITRPALSDERVQVNAAGQVELELKTPWRDGTTLFKSLMDGEHCLRGFTNRDIRSRLTGTRWLRACACNPKKASAKIGRCFRRLHAHGLIAKIPRAPLARHRLRQASDGHVAVPARASLPQRLHHQRSACLIFFAKDKDLTTKESMRRRCPIRHC